MYELIAIGPGGGQRWRRPLPAEALVRLGRSPLDGWAVPWDMRISREHADLLLAGERLHIRCLDSAHNDIHCGAQRLRDAAIGPRETFRIGSTIFCLVPAGEPIADSVVQGGRESPKSNGLCPDPHGWPAVDPDHRLMAYTPVEAVYRGQWADIYMARHSSLGRWTAVQLQVAGGDADDESAVRLRQKCQLLASFRHPHLPICHDAGAIDGRVFLAMEWIEGQDLVAAAGGGLLSIPRALDLVCQASRALAYAHQCGVVHREVAPAHVLVDRDGQVVLIGWSRALRLGDSSLAAFERRDRLIADPEYSAPEQIADCRRVDRRADIYSLGCTLYWLLTGRVPFPGRGFLAAQRQHQPRLGEFRRDAPEPLEGVLRKMIANVPEERFARMEDVLAALEPLSTSAFS